MLFGIQTSDDRFDNSLRLIGVSNRNGNNACLFGRVVVSAYKQGVPDINHLLHRNAENVSQFLNSVGFVNARLGDVNRCRTTNSDREIGNQSIKCCFDLLPLGEISIPFLLLFERCLLAERGIGYLASPIINGCSPRLLDLKAVCCDRFFQGTDNLLFLIRREVFCSRASSTPLCTERTAYRRWAG